MRRLLLLPPNTICITAALLLLLLPLLVSARTYKFALCPKFVNNSYFDVSRDGCVDRAHQLSLASQGQDEIECAYVGHAIPGEFGDLQAEAILAALEQEDFDGLSISVTEAAQLKPVYEAAKARNIPVVMFDSDDPASGRAAYIGTDNFFMGEQLAKVLLKLAPLGGTYAILTSEAPNLNERASGIQSVLMKNETKWSPVPNTLLPGGMVSYGGNNSLGLPLMRETLKAHPELTAFLAVNAAGMGYEEWPDLVKEYPNTIFIAGDDDIWQLEYLKVNKIHGLVGQIPYEMGVLSVDALLKLAKGEAIPEFLGTNVLEHLVVPLDLPPLKVDENRLPLWAVILGVILLVTVWVTALLFTGWTMLHRQCRIVIMAQPEFLILVAVGCMILSSTLIPLSMEQVNAIGSSSICMAFPWLLCVGFTVIFSALFAKTWRVNHVVRASRSFRRTALTQMDVLKPLLLLLLANVIVLTAWTIADPLVYVRQDAEGTDPWNRVIATYGQCESERSSLPYVLVLAFLNIGVLIIANYQAFKARKIDSEFSESRYIGTAIVSLLQAAAVGAPVLLLVRDNPLAWYLTLAFMIFFVAFGVLCLMFIPKIQAASAPMDEQSNTNWNGKSQRRFSSSQKSAPFNNMTPPPPTVAQPLEDQAQQLQQPEQDPQQNSGTSITSHPSAPRSVHFVLEAPNQGGQGSQPAEEQSPQDAGEEPRFSEGSS